MFIPLAIFIIIVAVVVFIVWKQIDRTKTVRDTRPDSETSAKCRVCGQDNPPEARFCGNCGANLTVS